MRAAIYLRNSDPRQAATGTHEGQLADAERRARDLGAEVVALYSDEGKSAKSGTLARRGDFARLVSDAKARAFDLVIVANVDRLSRTDLFRELGDIWGPLQEANVKLATTGGGLIDLNSPDGQLLALFESWRSAQENRARRERTIRGRQRAAREGRPPGVAPWGLRFVAGEGWQETEHAPLVREMFRRVAAGESTETIAADMQARAVENPRGGRWRRDRVYALVTAEAYRGAWRANGDQVVKLPPLVDDETWFAAQRALSDAKRKGLRRTRRTYLLEASAACGICGAPIHIRSPSDGHGYYVCARRRSPRLFGGGSPCTLRPQRTDAVDAALWDAIGGFLTRPDLLDEAIGSRRSAVDADGAAWERDVADWNARLARLAEHEASVLSLARRGRVSASALERELEGIGTERAMLERQIATAREQAAAAVVDRAQLEQLAAHVDLLRERLPAAPPELRRRFVRATLRRIVVTPQGVEAEGLLVAASGVDLGGASGCRSTGETQPPISLPVALVVDLEAYRRKQGRPREPIAPEAVRAAVAAAGSYRAAARLLGTSESTIRRRARE